MKISKLLLAACLFCVAMLFALIPAFNVVAQTGATNTPAIIIVTATPNGAAGAVATGDAAAAAPPAAVGTEDASVPYDKRLIRTALAALSTKLKRKITIVKGYDYELKAFPDSLLGCGPQGESAVKGDTWGYQVIVRPFDGKTYEIRVIPDLSRAFFCGEGAGAPVAAAVSGVTGKAVGGAFEAGAQIYGFGGSTVARLKTAGLKWIKVQVTPSDNGAIDRISAAHAQGFKILLSVKGDRSEVLNPGFFDQYATYVGNMAKNGADAIEIWNEMNIDREWPTGKIDPASYTQLLQKSYAAIKAGNGNTIVISGALAPTGFFGAGGKADAGWNDDVYYQGMAGAGAAAYMDCVGLHYNEGILSPTVGSGDPRGGYPTYYFDSMLNRALGPFPGMKACFTEIGFLTPQGYGPLPGGFAWAQNTTVAQQAQWIAEAAVKAAAGGKVRLMIIFNMDFVRYDADPQAGYALIRPDGTCPACDALSKVLQ